MTDSTAAAANPMDSFARDFLLKDWEAAHTSRENYANARLAILGASLTILGLVVSLGSEAAFPGVVGIWAVLLVVVFASVFMIGAINRAVYVFGAYMRVLEDEIGQPGFATCWAHQLATDPRDAATAAFRIALRLVNATVAALVAGSAWLTSRSAPSDVAWWSSIVVLLVAPAMALVNERAIRRELSPTLFYSRIEASLRTTRQAVRLPADATNPRVAVELTGPEQSGERLGPDA